MKSLEILEHVKNAPEFMGGDERYKNSINSSIKYTEDIMTIKQDLEVLEIINKNKVEVLHLWYIIKTNEEKDNEYILMKYNESFGNQRYELTMEELLKLKQWLEVN